MAGTVAAKRKQPIKNNPELSLIFPVYNEHIRLLTGLSGAVSYLSKQRFSWEMILVDDGSLIPVEQAVHEVSRKHEVLSRLQNLPFRIYRLPKNMGKGAALAYGIRHAHGGKIIFSDIDLSVPLEKIPEAVKLLERYDLVIGSRRLPESQIVVHQSPVRETSGRIFTWLSNEICQMGVHDATCGFKAFRAEAAKHLFGVGKINRWVFDAEVLFLARKYGFTVGELPVTWTNKEGSKVKTFDSMQSFIDLLRIRWYDMMGKYEL